MKIAISELKPQEALIDIDSIAGEVVVGGETQVEIFSAATASGDLTFTKSKGNVYSFEYKSKRGVYSGSLGFGYALAFSYTEY